MLSSWFSVLWYVAYKGTRGFNLRVCVCTVCTIQDPTPETMLECDAQPPFDVRGGAEQAIYDVKLEDYR